jgi:hypothetical protein
MVIVLVSEFIVKKFSVSLREYVTEPHPVAKTEQSVKVDVTAVGLRTVAVIEEIVFVLKLVVKHRSTNLTLVVYVLTTELNVVSSFIMYDLSCSKGSFVFT